MNALQYQITFNVIDICMALTEEYWIVEIRTEFERQAHFVFFIQPMC